VNYIFSNGTTTINEETDDPEHDYSDAYPRGDAGGVGSIPSYSA
jgi:hypothetical protein